MQVEQRVALRDTEVGRGNIGKVLERPITAGGRARVCKELGERRLIQRVQSKLGRQGKRRSAHWRDKISAVEDWRAVLRRRNLKRRIFPKKRFYLRCICI